MLGGWLRAELARAQQELIAAWRERALAAEKREAELAAQLRMVLEERFYHPVVTAQSEPAAPAGPVLPAGILGGEDYPDEHAIRAQFERIVAEHEAERHGDGA